METLTAVFVFAFGTIVGSFLNVLTLRRGTGMGLAGASFCFACNTALSWYELIPILSFLIQRGKCRRCGSRIALQYPIVEALSGTVFLTLFFAAGGALAFLYYAVVFGLLLAVVVYDVRHKIVPNELVYLFDALAFFSVLHGAEEAVSGPWSFTFGPVALDAAALATGIAFFGLLGGLWDLSRGRGMGLGDAKLSLGIGWLLGLSAGSAALILAFWSGALYGLSRMALHALLPRLFSGMRAYTMKSELPFAPFLVLGTILVFVFDIALADIGAVLTLPFF